MPRVSRVRAHARVEPRRCLDYQIPQVAAELRRPGGQKRQKIIKPGKLLVSYGHVYSYTNKDGRLKPGDQLVWVNKESMIGVSFEEAKNIITRAKLRSESPWEIAFIRPKSYIGHPGNICCPSPLQASEDCGPQTSAFNPFSSPRETLVPKTSSTPKTQDSDLPSFKAAQTKPGYNKTEHTPITSLDNSPTNTSNSDIAPTWTDDDSGPQGKKISLNPSVRLKAEKLEMLDEVNVSAHEISSILDSQLLPCDSLEADEMGKLRQERDAARAEVNVLKEAKAVAEETRALRSRLHLAEAAQRQAHGMEMDYEEVIHLLETEISELKAQLAHYSDQNKESIQDLRKRVTVLDCQLRKSEVARKTFKASTESLLHFVEHAAVFRIPPQSYKHPTSFNLDAFGKEVDESSSENKAFSITAFESVVTMGNYGKVSSSAPYLSTVYW
ncbi:syntaxin-binding protein 4 [Cricetulus griseus]|nr:syntaxin-binding protein 4 [Cricetulus griseus]